MLRISLFFIALTFSFFASAIEVKGLYEHRLAVDDKARDSRVVASQNALLNVVVKVSGEPSAINNKQVRSVLPNISDYMNKYGYDTVQGQDYITVEFDANMVNQLVQDAGLPLWGNRRPLVVVWLAIEDGWQRELLTSELYPQIDALVTDRAQRRGLPLVIPLLDLEDRQHVDVSDVWGNFSSSLDTASQRYAAERVVTARLYQEKQSGTWQLDWRFTNDDRLEPTLHKGDKQQVIVDMVDALATTLASEYAVDASSNYDAKAQQIKLYNTKSFTDIEQALRRLKSLSVVLDANVEQVARDHIVINLSHTGSVDDLQKALKLDQYFSDYRDPEAFYYSSQSNSSLEYTWQ